MICVISFFVFVFVLRRVVCAQHEILVTWGDGTVSQTGGWARAMTPNTRVGSICFSFLLVLPDDTSPPFYLSNDRRQHVA